MIKEMTEIAAECLKHPQRKSVWDSKFNNYVCPDSDEKAATVIADQAQSREVRKHPPIRQEFKLVFLTAAIGTLIFILLCVTLTYIVGKDPHPPMERLITGFFDLAKIGFGAIVGLLGGHQLQAEGDREGKR